MRGFDARAGSGLRRQALFGSCSARSEQSKLTPRLGAARAAASWVRFQAGSSRRWRQNHEMLAPWAAQRTAVLFLSSLGPRMLYDSDIRDLMDLRGGFRCRRGNDACLSRPCPCCRPVNTSFKPARRTKLVGRDPRHPPCRPPDHLVGPQALAPVEAPRHRHPHVRDDRWRRPSDPRAARRAH